MDTCPWGAHFLRTGPSHFLVGGATRDPTLGTCALVEFVWVPPSDPRVAFQVSRWSHLLPDVRLTPGSCVAMALEWPGCTHGVFFLRLAGGGAVGGGTASLKASEVAPSAPFTYLVWPSRRGPFLR